MLMLGSFLGYITGFIFNNFGLDLNLLAIASLGMAGFLSSTARTPITAVVMVFEMTGGYECILPLMLVAAVADLTAEKLNHKPIYAKLVVNQYRNAGGDFEGNLLVKDVMTINPKVISANDYGASALHLMEKYSITALAVVDNGKPIGVIHIHDLLKAGIA